MAGWHCCWRQHGHLGTGPALWLLCVLLSLGCAAGQAASTDPDGNNGTALPTAGNGTPFAWCDYGCDILLMEEADKSVTITMPNTQSGARIHTTNRYAYGNFSAMIKCPAGDITGLVPNFYTSSKETAGVNPEQDEIDFEFLGKNKTQVQVNYYVHGNSTGNEEVIDLGFDCSEAFHEYRIDWTPIRIKWFIDGLLVRTVYNLSGQPYPTLPGYVYSSIWDASGIDNGSWAGAPSSDKDAPFVFQLSRILAVELADKTFNDNSTAAVPAPAPAVTPPTPTGTRRPVPVPVATTGPSIPFATRAPSTWTYPGAIRRSNTTFLIAVVTVSGTLTLLLGGFIYAVIQRKRAFAAPQQGWTKLEEARDEGSR